MFLNGTRAIWATLLAEDADDCCVYHFSFWLWIAFTETQVYTRAPQILTEFSTMHKWQDAHTFLFSLAAKGGSSRTDIGACNVG